MKSPRKSRAAGQEGGAGRELRAGVWGAPHTTPVQVDRDKRDSEKGRAEQGWQEGGLLTPPHPRTTLRRLPPRPQGSPHCLLTGPGCSGEELLYSHLPTPPSGSQTGRGHEISLGSVAFMMIPQHAHTHVTHIHARTHPCANAPVSHTHTPHLCTQCLSPHLAQPPICVHTHPCHTHTHLCHTNPGSAVRMAVSSVWQHRRWGERLGGFREEPGSTGHPLPVLRPGSDGSRKEAVRGAG